MSSSEVTGRESHLRTLRDASVRLANHSGFYTDAVAARLGLNRTDVACLGILSLEGAVTAGQLAEATGLTTGGVSGILDRLERAGLVRRETDPDDRRRVIVRIAPGDARRLTDLTGPLERSMAALQERYSDAELGTLVDFTERSLALTQEATAALRRGAGSAADEREGDGVFSAPLSGRSAATLEFAGGANSVRLRGDAGMSDLFRAWFDGGDIRVEVHDNRVTVRNRWRPFSGHTEGEVVLNSTIPWTFEFRGGANRMTGDLADVPVAGIELSGGMSTTEFTLGAPTQTVPIRISGGASRMTFRRPAGVPVRFQARGGVSDLRLDGQRIGSSAGADWETPGYRQATGRYDISLRGGMSRLSVEAVTSET